MRSYLINSFYFQYQLFKAHLSEQFDFTFMPPGYDKPERAISYVWRNYLLLKKMYVRGEVAKFDVVQFNRAEAFLLFKKYPKQISIFEIHGFDIGVRGQDYLKDLHTSWKVWLGKFFDKLIEKKVIAKIQEPNILYVSTPDLVKPIAEWCGRTPQWLPNPIDTEQFNPTGPVIKLAGNPAIFLAARLHGDKKIEFVFDIFEKNILPKYPEAVLHLLETGELTAHYKQVTKNSPNYSWLPYMDKPKLAAVIRGSDLVFGDSAIGALSLLPMQVMACKKPIVTLDNYEIIKVPMEKLPELAMRLLANPQFRLDFVEKNARYINEIHSPEAVCKKHLENIQKYLKIKKI